jgi:tetratricopeptide (TPR) repeat protein
LRPESSDSLKAEAEEKAEVQVAATKNAEEEERGAKKAAEEQAAAAAKTMAEAEAAAKEKAKQAAETAVAKALEEAAATPSASDGAERLKAEGNKAQSEKRYADAVQKYSQAIEARPTDHVFWANRAASYLELNEAEKALADAIESARLEPRYMKAHFRQGLAYVRLDRGAEAVAALERAVAIDPTELVKQSLATAKKLAATQAATAAAMLKAQVNARLA